MRRLDRVIVTSLGAPEVSRRPGKGPRNHAPDFVWTIEHLARDFAHAVEIRNRDHIFMRRNLKDAVTGRVYDRKSGSDVLFAQLLDDFRAGGRFIADRFAPDGAFELLD